MPLQRICFAVAALVLTATTAMAGSHGKPKQAMFKTQAEAEAAAPGLAAPVLTRWARCGWSATSTVMQVITGLTDS